MQLQAVVDDAALALGEPILGHGGADVVELAGDKPFDAVVDKDSADLRLRLARRQREPGILQIEQRLPERRALFHVLRGDGHGMLRRSDRAHGDGQTLIRQTLHHLGEPLPFRPSQEVCGRDAHVVEKQFARVLAVHADLVERAPHAISRQVLGFHEDQRDPFPARDGRVGFDGQTDEAGVPAIRDERLRAVDDVAVADAPRGGTNALQVGTGGGLAHRDGAHQIAPRHARQPATFLRVAAVGEEVVRHDVLNTEAEVHAGLRELLQHHRRVRERSATAAKRVGHIREQHARGPRGGPRLGIGALLLTPAGLLRHQLLLDELADRRPEHPYVVGHPTGLVGHCSHCSTTTAPTKPRAGVKLARRQPHASPGVSATRTIVAGAPGASDTSTRSSG